MRKMADKKKVFEIAESLVRRGEKPSSRLIRQEIGGGSLATIQRHLRDWSGPQAEYSHLQPSRSDHETAATQSELMTRLENLLEHFESRLSEIHNHPLQASDKQRNQGKNLANPDEQEKVNPDAMNIAWLRNGLLAAFNMSTQASLPDDRILPLIMEIRALRADLTVLVDLLLEPDGKTSHVAALTEALHALRNEIRITSLAIEPLRDEVRRLCRPPSQKSSYP